MDCTQWNETWVAYLYDECTDEEHAQIEAHLASCESCREQMDALAATRRTLGDAAPEIAMPPRVVVLPTAPRSTPNIWGFAGGFAAAAALFVVGMLVGMTWFAPQPTQEIVLDNAGGADLTSEAARDNGGAALDPTYETGIQQVRNDYQELDNRLGRIESWLPQRQGEGLPRLATEDRLQVAVGNIYEQLDVRRQNDLQLFLQALYATEQNARQRDLTYRQAIEILNAEYNPNVRQK